MFTIVTTARWAHLSLILAITYFDLDLGPPVPTGTLGDELSPLSMITGNAPSFMSVTATDTHFLQ